MQNTNNIIYHAVLLTTIMVIMAQIVTSCASSLPIPRQEDLKQDRYNTLALDELRDGRALYVAKCSGCHSLYMPAQYSSSGWDTILTAMSPKAKITNDEAVRIRTYLTVYSNNN
ncbi:MAG: cytochrome c [Bacteroidota bacterium]